jgi:hypothetical protein
MDATTLTDRYVDAAMRTVPEKQRADLAAELQASIADQVDARVGSGEDADAAERAVLTELGDPDVLAAGYTGRVLHLIGPRYYMDWWRLLKLLLWIVPVCTAFAVALGQLIAMAAIGSVIGAAVVGALWSVVQVSFWVTLVFVVLERLGHETMDAGPWTPDRLPVPRRRGARLSDLVTSLVWLLLVAGAVLWDVLRGLAFANGMWMPVFDQALWPGWMIALFAILAAFAVVSVLVYRRGGWSYPLAAVHGILDVLLFGAIIWLLVERRLLNPELVSALGEATSAEVARILGVLLGLGLAIVGVWDALDAFLKARGRDSSRGETRNPA